MFRIATRLAGRTVLFSAYAVGAVLLTAGFCFVFCVALGRLAIAFSLAGDDEYEEDARAKKRFDVTIDGFERAARAMAFSPVVTARGRAWKF